MRDAEQDWLENLLDRMDGVRGLMECDDVSGIMLGQFAFDIHGPFFYIGRHGLFRIM